MSSSAPLWERVVIRSSSSVDMAAMCLMGRAFGRVMQLMDRLIQMLVDQLLSSWD